MHAKMQDVLEKYKERLIDINVKNRSLVLKKIYKKHSFDLFILNKFQNDIDKKILNTLVSRSQKPVLILGDPYSSHFLDDSDYLDEIISEIISYSKALSYLAREVSNTEKETGRYELYVGYPFVEGFLKDETFIRAPILLFPVKIYEKSNGWYLENIVEENVIINKVFLLAYSKINEIQLDEGVEIEIDNPSELGFNDIGKIVEYLNMKGIKIDIPQSSDVEKFEEIYSNTKIDYNIGQLVIKPYLILGRFPISNSIYQDYLKLEKTGQENELLNKLLLSEDTTYENEKTIGLDAESEQIKEQNFFFLTELDFSQEKAVKLADSTKELVIYGPPGTGKSQTIASIISDSLAKGKRVLMVSQKKAALDVVYNRLGKINSKIILLHDSNKDKKTFYDKVKSSLENIEAESQNIFELYSKEQGLLNEIKKYSSYVDNDISVLENIREFLHKEREFGLTLQKMYKMSKKISSSKDPRYEMFKIFKQCPFIEKFKYEEVTSGIENILNKHIVEDYFKYKEFLNMNILHKVREDIDLFYIQDYLENLTQIKNDYNNAEIKLCLDEIDETCKDMLLKVYKEKGNVSEDELISFSENINRERNGELLTSTKFGRWWNPFYWLNYKKIKEKEKKNREEYSQRGKEIYNNLSKGKEKIDSFRDKFTFLKNVLVEEEYKCLFEDLYNLKDLSTHIEETIYILRIYEDYRRTYSKVSEIIRSNGVEKVILDFVYQITKDVSKAYEIIKNNIEELFILYHITKIESQENEKVYLYEKYYDLVNDAKKYMSHKIKLISEYIIQRWNNEFIESAFQNPKHYREFKRQAEKKKLLWPIRKYADEFGDLLFRLFPCWLLSPESTSEVLPLVNGLFDIVIFDEASQMFVENAIPAIYRGKKVVIAGDDKQLRPTSAFKRRLDDGEEGYEDLETAAALEEESLLDLAKFKYKSTHLIYHYRSMYPELINFSNYAFYNRRLIIPPNLEKTYLTKYKPIERIKIEDGMWEKKTNFKEAEKVVELVKNILKSRKENETIGIITFNVAQQDLINDMLDHAAYNDLEFLQLLLMERNRIEDGEDKSLFVKNIENVQGDERDIIIFSIGYAPNEDGKIVAQFGSLSVEGGENRLNVAISRARKKIYVVTSIEPEELNVETTKNKGAKLLKKYLQYAREVSNGNKEMIEDILMGLLDSDSTPGGQITFESEFESEVYQALTERGFLVDTQVGVAGYRIDLAIYDPKTSSYVLGIECDGATYHSSKSARERDIHRQRFLESRGWNIIRIWSRDWWENSEKEIEKIERELRQIMKNYA